MAIQCILRSVSETFKLFCSLSWKFPMPTSIAASLKADPTWPNLYVLPNDASVEKSLNAKEMAFYRTNLVMPPMGGDAKKSTKISCFLTRHFVPLLPMFFIKLPGDLKAEQLKRQFMKSVLNMLPISGNGFKQNQSHGTIKRCINIMWCLRVLFRKNMSHRMCHNWSLMKNLFMIETKIWVTYFQP